MKTNLRLLFIFSIIFRFCHVFGQPGTIDTSFANHGLLSYPDYLPYGLLTNVIVQPDNKIVGGNANEFSLIRFSENGEHDTLFGNNGVTQTILNQYVNYSHTIFLQSDGKIIAVGMSMDYWMNLRAVIVRFNSDGTPDTAFGNGGAIVVDEDPYQEDSFSSVITQPDGKIVVGGSQTYDLVLFRYHNNGSLDQTFGASGEFRLNGIGRESVTSIAQRPDGKIVASTISFKQNSKNIILLQLNQDGSLDTTFGEHGLSVSGIGPGDDQSEHSLLIQPDGRILFAGFMTNQGNRGFLRRFREDGSIDSTFASNGSFIFDVYSKVNSISLQPDGKILAAIEKYVFAFMRFNSNGSVDSTFGNNGWVINSIDTGTSSNNATSVVLQHGGKIIAAGYASLNTGPFYNLVITRYLSGISCPNPMPHYTYQANDTIVSFYDNSSSATKWDWEFGDGSFSTVQNPVHTYTGSGNYYACLNISDTCGSSYFCDSIIIRPAHINSSIKIYPCPTSDFINIDLSFSNLNFKSAQIISAQGVIVREYQISQNNKLLKFNVADINSGFYFLKFSSDSNATTKKIIKINK